VTADIFYTLEETRQPNGSGFFRALNNRLGAVTGGLPVRRIARRKKFRGNPVPGALQFIGKARSIGSSSTVGGRPGACHSRFLIMQAMVAL
jgi:hypothetical protein